MATQGEKKVRLTQSKKTILKDPTRYWKYLEEEGKKCLQDI